MLFIKTNSVRFSKPSSVLPCENSTRPIYPRQETRTRPIWNHIIIHRNSTGAKYAWKSIPKRKLIYREYCDDVWREIQTMHRLIENPNVVTIKGTYEDSSYVHLVMELCEGELFDGIIAKGQYSEREAAKLMKTVISIVEACHSLGVIYRDLKPENLLSEKTPQDSSLKASDFSLSAFKGNASERK